MIPTYQWCVTIEKWFVFYRLKEELSASSALIQNLKADIQRKEEDNAELKEKLADAKKQIKQVQKEVGYPFK